MGDNDQVVVPSNRGYNDQVEVMDINDHIMVMWERGDNYRVVVPSKMEYNDQLEVMDIDDHIVVMWERGDNDQVVVPSKTGYDDQVVVFAQSREAMASGTNIIRGEEKEKDYICPA